MGDLTSPTVEQESTLTPGQRQLLDQLTGRLGIELGRGIEPYGGTVVPGVNAALEAGLSAQAGLGSMAEDRALLAAMSPEIATDVSPERYVSGFDETYGGALEDYWNRYAKRKIAHEYASGGTGGGVEEILAQSYATDVALPMAEARWAAHMRGMEAQQAGTEQALARAAQTAGMASGIDATRAEQAVRAGMTRRGMEAERLAEPYEKWLQAQAWQNPWITQFLGPALGTSAVQNIAAPSEAMQIAAMMGGAGAMKPK